MDAVKTLQATMLTGFVQKDEASRAKMTEIVGETDRRLSESLGNLDKLERSEKVRSIIKALQENQVGGIAVSKKVAEGANAGHLEEALTMFTGTIGAKAAGILRFVPSADSVPERRGCSPYGRRAQHLPHYHHINGDDGCGHPGHRGGSYNRSHEEYLRAYRQGRRGYRDACGRKAHHGCRRRQDGRVRRAGGGHEGHGGKVAGHHREHQAGIRQRRLRRHPAFGKRRADVDMGQASRPRGPIRWQPHRKRCRRPSKTSHETQRASQQPPRRQRRPRKTAARPWKRQSKKSGRSPLR